jgi:hypothetical protein
MLWLHTRLPFFESFVGTTQFRSAQKGLLHKVPVEATMNIRCSAPHNIKIKTLSKKTLNIERSNMQNTTIIKDSQIKNVIIYFHL